MRKWNSLIDLRMIFLLMVVICSFWGEGEASVEPWYINTDTIRGYRPVVVLKDEKDTANLINQDINNYIYTESQSYAQVKFYKRIDYEVTYEDDKFVSLLIYVRGYNDVTNSNYEIWHGLTYAKTSGERLNLGYFLKIKASDLIRLGWDNLYSATTQTYHKKANINYKNIRPNIEINQVFNNYYLLEDGGIVIIYPHEYLNNTDGNFAALKLDLGQVKYYVWRSKNGGND